LTGNRWYRYETKIPAQLLVAVEQLQAGIVGGKIYFDFLIAPDDHYIIHHAGCLTPQFW
jgi:hypothetical protein